MTQSKVKVKVREVRNLRKWPISKSISSAGLDAIKTNGELWYSETISKLWLDRFLIFLLVQRHVIFKLRVLHLRQTNFAYEESIGSPVYGAYSFAVRVYITCSIAVISRRSLRCFVLVRSAWVVTKSLQLQIDTSIRYRYLDPHHLDRYLCADVYSDDCRCRLTRWPLRVTPADLACRI